METKQTTQSLGRITVGIPFEGSESIIPSLEIDLPIDLVIYPPLGGDLSELAEVEFLVLQHHRPDLDALLMSLANLRVTQILLAGYDWITGLLPPHSKLCNARGSRDVAVSEWVMGALLGTFSGVLEATVRQPSRVWSGWSRHELSGRKVLIVGMGPIGDAIRSRCEAFDIDVVGFARTARGSIQSVSELPTHLSDAEAVILVTPLTSETRGMFDANKLAMMKDGAVLINAARGAVVDTEALIRELSHGRLRAVLDVVDPEPLPPESELWRLPGVFISPHLGGRTYEGDLKALRIAAEQINRYVKGESMHFVVAESGY
jgi:phosphoglycerate dehydrogenase-like enzyme